jgi:hypothetical protein
LARELGGGGPSLCDFRQITLIGRYINGLGSTAELAETLADDGRVGVN